MQSSSAEQRHISKQIVSNDSKTAIVGVFCGALEGKSPAHLEAARSLGRVFHQHNIGVVYGGGTKGLMGGLIDTLVKLSGLEAVQRVDAKPFIYGEPDAVDSEIDRLRRGDSMHARKQNMADTVLGSDSVKGGFIVLSGGYGTLDELMEIVITFRRADVGRKCIVLYNVEGYWDDFLQWSRDAVHAGFLAEKDPAIIFEAKTALEVVSILFD